MKNLSSEPDKFEVVKEFTEVASAKYVDCRKRPLLCEAVGMCEKSGFTLVVAKVDRLSRTTEHALEIFSKLEGRLISCDIPNLDKFTLTLYMAIADREREMISIRTKQALKAKKARNGHIKAIENEKGAENLRKTNAQKKAVEANIENAKNNENNQRAADYAKMLREKGMTLEAIAEHLNNRKFVTSNKKQFHKTTVSRLIAK